MVRTLGSVLTSAAASFALFAAANWGPVMFEVMFLTGINGFIKLLIAQTITSVGFPQVGLYQSIENAIKVWRVRRTLRAIAHRSGSADQPLENGHTAIMAVCPLFLQIPASQEEELRKRIKSRVEADSKLSREDLTLKWCPLELRPAAASKSRQSSKDVDKRQPQLDQEAVIYIQVHQLEDRVALLASCLVPGYNDLRYLRRKNRFQTTVTAIQAGGYMLGLAERLMQHLDISPVEAIISFLCLLAVLQMLIEFYVCSNYQRPLLLCLAPQQVTSLESWKDLPTSHGLHGEICNRLSIINFTCANLLLFIMALPLSYYVYHYWHRSLLSALAVLLFILAVAASSVLFTRDEFTSSDQGFCPWDREIPVPYIDFPHPLRLSEVCSGVLCGCGLVLAVVVTVVYWPIFREPPVNPFAWALPHASTS